MNDTRSTVRRLRTENAALTARIEALIKVVRLTADQRDATSADWAVWRCETCGRISGQLASSRPATRCPS